MSEEVLLTYLLAKYGTLLKAFHNHNDEMPEITEFFKDIIDLEGVLMTKDAENEMQAWTDDHCNHICYHDTVNLEEYTVNDTDDPNYPYTIKRII